MAEKEHTKGFLKGAVIGTIIGGVTALLFAPKSGKETQQDIKDGAKKAIKIGTAKLNEVEGELSGRIDELKVAARDLHGQAYEESQRLITRAEMLKHDLGDSAARLAKGQKDLADGAQIDAKRLVREGQEVIAELERVTKKVMKTARDKASDTLSGGK